MAKITALIHTANDEQRIGRAIESLRPCDEVLVIDHGSHDRTPDIARQHGARVKPGVPGVDYGVYAAAAHHDWILCVRPSEALSEFLEATLFEWKQQHQNAPEGAPAFGYAFRLREETPQGWQTRPPETRLVNRQQVSWQQEFPPHDPNAQVLPGELLCFHEP